MDPSPFRSELEAALEKVDRLAAENAELRSRVRFTKDATPRRKVILILGLVVAVDMLALCVAALLMARSSPTSPPYKCPSESSNGIAIAPLPRAADSLPAPRLEPCAPGPPAKPCSCTPGDPICSCL